MKRIVGTFVGAAALLAIGASTATAAVVYTSRADFLAVTPNLESHKNSFTEFAAGTGISGLFESVTYSNLTFRTVNPDQSGSTPITSAGYTLTAADGVYAPADAGLLQAASDTIRIEIPDGAWAVGGSFFTADGFGGFAPGSLTFGFADGSTNLISGASTDFLGVVSDHALITWVQIVNPDYGNDQLYPTVDDLYVVPEPSVVIMNLGVLAGVGAFYYRRRISRK